MVQLRNYLFLEMFYAQNVKGMHHLLVFIFSQNVKGMHLFVFIFSYIYFIWRTRELTNRRFNHFNSLQMQHVFSDCLYFISQCNQYALSPLLCPKNIWY